VLVTLHCEWAIARRRGFPSTERAGACVHGASLMCQWGAVIICRCADIVPPREMVILVAVLAIGCVEAQVCDPLHSGRGNAGEGCFDHRRVCEHLRSSNDTVDIFIYHIILIFIRLYILSLLENI
jgi:hypothetical protein